MPATRSIIGKRCATFEEIRTQTQLIAKKFNPRKIILFGSYAYGKPTPESDVDLLVITDLYKSKWELSAEIALTVDHAFPLDIIIKTMPEVEARLAQGDFFIEDIINKGKVLYERTRTGMD
jgi:predicted nucleotidyltransferase